MQISSRTPEGEPNHCPVCGKACCLEPTQLFGDAPCPHCGHLLWFVAAADGVHLADRNHPPEHLLGWLAAHLNVTREELRDRWLADPQKLFENAALDSLDTVELVMALEEEDSDRD